MPKKTIIGIIKSKILNNYNSTIMAVIKNIKKINHLFKICNSKDHSKIKNDKTNENVT